MLRFARFMCLAAWCAAPVFADEPFPPHKIIGNVYYVGSKALAIYLITTPDGHILINSGFEETVALIRVSVETLGFNLRDVKILLASHAHSGHVAGHARLKELTGAQVYVLRGDENVIASGGAGQYLYTWVFHEHNTGAFPCGRIGVGRPTWSRNRRPEYIDQRRCNR